jgi:hypothetical protein
MVTEYFYAALHMFEAAVFDFPELADGKKHFATHQERREFFRTNLFAPANELQAIGPLYTTLRGLSERARYLSPAGTWVHSPLKTRDLPEAKRVFEAIRGAMEELYGKRKADAPWLKSESPGAGKESSQHSPAEAEEDAGQPQR